MMLGWAITLSTLPWYLPPYFIPNCWFSLPSRYRAARGERLPGPLPATQFTYNALRQARVNRVSEFDIIESLSSVIFTQLTVCSRHDVDITLRPQTSSYYLACSGLLTACWGAVSRTASGGGRTAD